VFTAPLLSSARAALIMAAAVLVGADGTPQPLPFAPAWTDPSLIAADDAWTGVPGVQEFLGQGITSITGTDPRAVRGTTTDGDPVDVSLSYDRADD
jgi:hypothetical protein